MFKRVLLGLTFVAALGAASFVTTSEASAYGGCGRGGYGGYRTAYYPGYGPAYGYGYGPRVVAYPGAYPVYYRGYDGGRRHHDHHDHYRDNRVTFSFGF